MTNWYQFGVEMAQKFCDNSSGNSNEYAKCGSQYIAECENISGTEHEKTFCDGWSTIVSLDGEVRYRK